MSGEAPVSRRLVLLFPGFEPLNAKAHHARFARAAELTGPVWDLPIHVGPLNTDGLLPSFNLSDGAGTQTEFVIGCMEPVMRHMSDRPVWARTVSGLSALASFAVNGTFWNYLRTSWRYGLFFLYPAAMLCAVFLIAAIVGLSVSHMAGSPAAGLAIGLGAALALFVLACRKAHFLLMMDLWAYARILATGKASPALDQTEALITQSLSRVAASDQGAAPQEIILVGHSIGAVLAVQLAGRISSEFPALAQRVHLLTLGSGLLQVACHPQAAELRRITKRLLCSGMHWMDVQALIDPVNFLHSRIDLRFDVVSANYREIIIRMRHLLSEKTYHRIKFNFFRVHRQYVLPVERRQNYSFHMLVAGPAPFAEIMRNGGLPLPTTDR